MTRRDRASHRLALISTLLALLPATAVAGPWAQTLLDPAGRSPLDSLPRSPLPAAWVLVQPASYMPGSPTERSTSVSIDPVSGTIRESTRQGSVEMGEPIISDLASYDTLLTRRNSARIWRQLTRQSRSVVRTGPTRGGLFRVDLPVQLPKPIRAIVGDGTPNLEVSGSETITLSGQSDWVVNRLQTEVHRQSAFPSLEMKQELNVNLTGSIGDKIKVDVDQSSNVTSSLDNKVKLRYEGDQDDMVQSVELGNTNLSLAGASYRQEGLFGVKSVMKLGTVDLTTIVSKQEGKSETSRFTPSGEKRSVRIFDLSYIQRKYFFIADHPLNLVKGSLQVYRDDQNVANNITTGAVSGLARLNPSLDVDSTSNPQKEGTFDRLIEGQDYDIITPYITSTLGASIPVIKLRVLLGPTEILGVRYVEQTLAGQDTVGSVEPVEKPALHKDASHLLLKIIRPGQDDVRRDPAGRYDPTDPMFAALYYELRNYYDLTARNIALETLTLVVRRSDASLAVDPDNIDGVPLLQILGLDQVGAPGSANANKPDGKIDAQYIDPIEGTIFFPDLHPFDPDTTTLASCAPGFSGFLCLDNRIQNILREKPGNDLANPKVYYFKTTDPSTDARYYIDAQFRSSQQGYFLGRFNILENSEQVKVDGILQKRGTDYSIDYETGQVNFIRPPGPDQVITVDYSFAPGVGQVQRTLLGFSSSYNPGTNFSLSSSMLYESRGASEQNPKLGDEPAHSLVGDLSTVATFHPSFMTSLANLVPGVRTNQQSALNVQGGMALSLPNPNTQGEAYLDDMEGNKESTALPLGRTQWMWSSIPFSGSGVAASDFPADHALIQWYNARGVKEKDLNPVLRTEEGSDNEHQVLELNIDPNTRAGSTAFTAATWTGLTQGVSRTGDDYSKLRFLEIWVNDKRPLNHAQTSGVLHVDLGRVSEDAFWNPVAPPNGTLDTEDKNGDNKLDVGEDTGLDRTANRDEPGYDPASNPDPSGDDYHYDSNHPNDYSHINGTEGNGQGDPNARPDTEDLDLNGVLDTQNDYFEASIDLATSNFVAIDVARDYPTANLRADNGWRLFRIPIEGTAFQRYGSPNWDSIKHLRFWLSDFAGNTTNNVNVQIGGIELVGNRWLRVPITDSSQVARGVDLDVRTVDNKETKGYTAPFSVPNAVGGSATQREQSLALGFSKLSPGDSVFAFKTVGDAGTGVGYTQYREIRYYVHGEDGAEAKHLRLVSRFGADTVSYYEYSRPIVAGWQSVVVPMEVLSRLKDQVSTQPGAQRVTVDSLSDATGGGRYTVVGNPSFTRVGRISFGVTHFGGPPDSVSGEVWIDELRLAGVRKDTGTSTNMTVQANFADVLALNAAYQNQDADFFQVGSGVNRGSGFNHSALGVTTTFNVDRMLPRSGLQVPLRLSFQNSKDVPKYRIGSDVVLDPSRSDLETSSQTRQAIDLSYRRTGLRKGMSRYTIDALSGGFTYSRQGSITPQSADSSWSFQSNANYDIPLGGGHGINLGRRLKIKYLPEVINFSGGWTSTRTVNYSRDLTGASDLQTLRSDAKTRRLDLGGGLSYAPISSVNTRLRITSQRDMLLHQEGPLGFNKGTEIGHTQQMEVSWIPRWLTSFSPNVSLTGSYQERGGPDQRISQADSALDIKTISNQGTARATTKIPLGRLGAHLARPRSARDTTGTGLLTPIRFLLSKLEDVQASFGMDRSTAISRVTGDPGFAFRSGLTQVFGPGLSLRNGSNMTSSRRYSGGANTSLHPLPAMNIDLRADRSLSFSDAYSSSRRTSSLSWPDVTVRWLELQRPLGLIDQFSSLTVNTHYSLKVDSNGPEGQPSERRIESTAWAPLLGWQASWRNGLRTDVTTAYSTVRDIDETSFGVTRERSSQNQDIRLTKLFPASRGIKFPWSKKRIRLPNDLNLNLGITMQTDQQTTLYRTGQSTLELDQQSLSVSSGTSYNFSQSVTGGFNLGFRQTNDRKSAIIQRSVNIAFTAQFRF